MASTNAVLSTIIGPPGFASSRRTLDLDSLTFQTMFLRSQVGLDPSVYYLPIIPGDGTVVKQLKYYTVQQALSVGGFYLTPSTIGDLINEVTVLSTNQIYTNEVVSSVSTIVGSNIENLNIDIATYQAAINAVTFTPAYNNMRSTYNAAILTNSTANSIQSNVNFLTSGLSSLSTLITSSFTWLNTRIETVFNQGPAVSSLSTFVFEYFNYLSESVSSYSTSVGSGISTNSNYQISTLIGYSNLVNASIQLGTGPGVSSLSTIITSTFLSTQVTLVSYNPAGGMSSISSFVTPALSSFSTQFNIQLAIPGICSLSTYYTSSYINSIANAREQSGVFGISTLNSTLSTTGGLILENIDAAANLPLSSFSTAVFTNLNMISDLVCTIGFSYVILQQELVKVSISSVSTSFGIDYRNMTNLSTYSTMLDPAYSTLYNYFNVSSPYNSISTLSTVQQSTILGTTNYLNTIYPEIFTGPGISSIATNQPIQISSLSTSLGRVFSTFSNDIYNISAIRTDTGVSSLSSFLIFSTLQIQSTTNEIANFMTFLTVSTTHFQQQISSLLVYDSTLYSSLQLSTNILELTLQLYSTTVYISSVSLYYAGITSSMSTFLSTSLASSLMMYGDVQSSFISTTDALFQDYILVSSLASTNLFYPVFSSFYADIITTSSLVSYQEVRVSTLIIAYDGLTGPTIPRKTLNMKGTLYIEPQPYLGVEYVFVGACNVTEPATIFYAKSGTGTVNPIQGPSPLNQFTFRGNDVIFAKTSNADIWVAVGDSAPGFAQPVLYSTDPANTWANGGIPGGMTALNCVMYDGSNFFAGGAGSATIIQTTDVTFWNNFVTVNMSSLTNVKKMAYDGTRYVAVGENSLNPYTIVYGDDVGTGIPDWKSGGNTFSSEGRGVTTNGRIWVAVGAPEAIKYSFNGRSWFSVTGASFSTAANAVLWNGEKFVAVGQNTNNSNVLYSYNGQSWYHTDADFGYEAQSIMWDGSNWLAIGLDTAGDATSTRIYSPDGINWTRNVNPVTAILRGQAFASNVRPTIEMTTFDIFSGNFPAMLYPDKRRMQIIQSTIVFNDGDFVIRHNTDVGVGYVGINQAYPEYALDIGIGNARKPSGTTWVTSSDARVKTNITTVDTFSCAQTLLQIPLRQFSYTESYLQQTGIRDIPYYGFIAQEVKQVLPDSVRISSEFGLPDFHSLDADQLFKIEFGATQYLMKAVEEVEQKLSTLESYQKNRR